MLYNKKVTNPVAKKVIFFAIESLTSKVMKKYQNIFDQYIYAYTMKSRLHLETTPNVNLASLLTGAPVEFHTVIDKKEPYFDVNIPIETTNDVFPTIFHYFGNSNEIWTTDQTVKGFLEPNVKINLIESCLTIKSIDKNNSVTVIHTNELTKIIENDGFDTEKYNNHCQKILTHIKDILSTVNLDDTFVVLTSLNGGVSGDNKINGGITLDELEVPVLYFNNHISKIEIAEPHQITDILATALYCCNINPLQATRGLVRSELFKPVEIKKEDNISYLVDEEVTNLKYKKEIKHIIIFGSDASGSYLIKNQLDKLKNFKYLTENGAYSFNSRSVVPIVSGVNWSSIINATPVNYHGCTEWNSYPPEFPAVRTTDKYDKVPSLFYLFKKKYSNEQSCAFFRWSHWQYMIETEEVDYWRNYLVKDDYWPHTKNTEVISDRDNFAINQYVVDKAIEYINEHTPKLSLIYVNEPDTTGHRIGHHTEVIYKNFQFVDKWVGQVLEMIDKNPKLKDNTLFVYCADHGGRGQGPDCHGNFNADEIEVPIIMYGANVIRPGLIKESLIQYDLIKTIAWLWNLKIPNTYTGNIIYSPFLTDQELANVYIEK